MKKLLLIVVAIALLSACAPKPEKTAPKDASAFVNSFVYTKANNGLCFAVGTYSRLDTNADTSYELVVVNVPCEKVAL